MVQKLKINPTLIFLRRIYSKYEPNIRLVEAMVKAVNLVTYHGPSFAELRMSAAYDHEFKQAAFLGIVVNSPFSKSDMECAFHTARSPDTLVENGLVYNNWGSVEAAVKSAVPEVNKERIRRGFMPLEEIL